MRLVFVLVGAGLLLAGCGGREELIGRPELAIVPGSELPPPGTVDLISTPRPFLIGPLDQVSVETYGVPELSRSVQVDASGRISMPLVGSLQASGKTPAQLAEEIAAQLRGRYVRDPRVIVNLTETVSQQFTVSGAVTTPGLFPVTGRMTLVRAIARAQGTSEFARENYVVVFRRVNNREMAALYDLRAIRQGRYADPEIFANDVVVVGDSQARRTFRDVLSVGGFLAGPLIALVQTTGS
jgi:polysaccharide export outer membrane protein